MTTTHSPVLEFPAMLHGSTGTVRRAVEAESRRWVQDYREARPFTQPREMRQVASDESLEMRSGAVFDVGPRWRIHMFANVFMHLKEGVPVEGYRRARDFFETFCLSTPWGALYHAVTPPHRRSAERMTLRFKALLRFWDVLQGPRYVLTLLDAHHTLEDLIDSIYRTTLDAWCPERPSSVREHLLLTVEHMARASREECMQTVLRVIPAVVRMNTDFQNRSSLTDPDFLRERLAGLSPEDFEDVSSAEVYAVNRMLYAWDRALGRR